MYGMLEFGISMDFDKGNKISETYFFKKRMVSRKKYEKERVELSRHACSGYRVGKIGALK